MNVIGNNIANINTIGFKSGMTNFQDLFSRTVSGTERAYQVGLGVGIADVTTSLVQGAIQSTSNPTDIAIQGNGFFMLKESTESDEYLFTRAGNFGINEDGYLSTPTGLLVQGYQAGPDGQIDISEILPIDLQSGKIISASQTTSVTMSGNLKADDEIISATMDSDDSTTYNFKQTVRIFDSRGGEHTLQICFQKSGENAWNYSVFVDPDELEGGTPATGLIEDGTLTFNEDGSMNTHTEGTTTAFTFIGASQIADLDLDFGTGTADGGTGLDGLTQLVSESSSINFYSQNGKGSGTLESITIDSSGIITGYFSNGETRVLAQVILASFTNAAGLNKIGNNVFGQTVDSGSPINGVPGTGGRGSLVGNALEMSNVDLAAEFTNMITGQRGYQANSRIISTTDEMIQDLLMIKR